MHSTPPQHIDVARMQTVLSLLLSIRRVVPLRLTCIAAVAALCMAFAAAVLWTWLDPDVLAGADATPLLGLLGLFLLPAGVIATYRLDRRLRAENKRHDHRVVQHQAELSPITAEPDRSILHRARPDRPARSTRGRRLAAPRP